MVVHATGIVMDDVNPYIVVVLSSANGDMGSAYYHVKNTFSKIAPIMVEYSKYKTSLDTEK